MNSNTLSTTSIEKEFQSNGFVGPIDVLSPEEAHAALLEVVTELGINLNPQKKKNTKKYTTNVVNNKEISTTVITTRSKFKLHLLLPTLDTIAHHPLIISAVRKCLGNKSNLLLWSSDINIKEFNTASYFALHQDSTYSGLLPSNKCVTVWIALSDPVGIQEGCLSFYPQPINEMKQLPHTTCSTSSANNSNDNNDDNSDNMLSMGQYIAKETLHKVKCGSPVSVPLRSGQMTIHSFYSIHYSGPNNHNHSTTPTPTRGSPRIGFALRYIDGTTVQQSKTIISGVKEMVTPIDIDIDIDSDNSFSTTTTTRRKSNSNSNSSCTGSRKSPTIFPNTTTSACTPNFDFEPRLPFQPTIDDIQRMRHIREEAMNREDSNYFSTKSKSKIVS